jgi:hypothetical protein
MNFTSAAQEADVIMDYGERDVDIRAAEDFPSEFTLVRNALFTTRQRSSEYGGILDSKSSARTSAKDLLNRECFTV